MILIFKLKGAVGGALTHLQSLGAWLRRYVASSPSGQPWERSPGAYALLAGVHRRDD
jgi:hypothetical protein